jgi:hypothetical protein
MCRTATAVRLLSIRIQPSLVIVIAIATGPGDDGITAPCVRRKPRAIASSKDGYGLANMTMWGKRRGAEAKESSQYKHEAKSGGTELCILSVFFLSRRNVPLFDTRISK